MESDIFPINLKDEICNKKTKLNELIVNGINKELIELSQELDILINDYSRIQMQQ